MTYIHFAKLFGIVSTVLALGMLFNPDNAKKLASELLDSGAGFIVSGVLPVIFGGWIIVNHNVWVLAWPVVVTAIGWMMLVSGVFRLLFVETWTSVMRRHIDKIPVLFSLFGLIVGLLLIYVGFFAHLHS
jgi:hypothetical protein